MRKDLREKVSYPFPGSHSRGREYVKMHLGPGNCSETNPNRISVDTKKVAEVLREPQSTTPTEKRKTVGCLTIKRAPKVDIEPSDDEFFRGNTTASRVLGKRVKSVHFPISSRGHESGEESDSEDGGFEQKFITSENGANPSDDEDYMVSNRTATLSMDPGSLHHYADGQSGPSMYVYPARHHKSSSYPD